MRKEARGRRHPQHVSAAPIDGRLQREFFTGALSDACTRQVWVRIGHGVFNAVCTGGYQR